MKLITLILVLSLKVSAQNSAHDLVESFYSTSLEQGQHVQAHTLEYEYLDSKSRYACSHYEAQFQRMREVQRESERQLISYIQDENSSDERSVEALVQEWRASDLFLTEAKLAKIKLHWKFDNPVNFEMSDSFKLFHYDSYKGSSHDEFLLLLGASFENEGESFSFQTQVGYDEVCWNGKVRIVINPSCRIKNILSLNSCDPKKSIILNGNLNKLKNNLNRLKKGRNRIGDVRGGTI